MWCTTNALQNFSRPRFNIYPDDGSEFQTTVEESDRGRYYAVPGCNKYPSVTTVLGRTKSDYDRGILRDWQQGIGVENARVKTEQAADRGSLLHSTIEDFFKCQEETFETSNPLFHKYHKELCKLQNIRAFEKFLYSHRLKLAGRVDCVAEYNGELSIIDFKTSTKQKEEFEIEDYYIQETAYAIMYAELYNVKITQIVTLIGAEKSFYPCQVFVKKPANYVGKLLTRIKQYENVA